MRKRLKETFAKLFPAEGSVRNYSSFDIIGDIAIIKIPNSSAAKPETIAEAIMARHGNVKAVFVQTSGITGDYRLRSLKHVAGGKRTGAVHREISCCFAGVLGSCQFFPWLPQ